MDDRAIVDLFWARSERALEATAKKYGAYCYSVAFGVLADRCDAEETVNDTYLDAWNCIPPHRPSVLSTFLGKITRRIAIDKYRRRTAEKRGGSVLTLALDELADVARPEDTEASAVDKEALAMAMKKFLPTLGVEARQMFLSRYWYFDSVKAIAARLGCSESRVKSTLSRAREKLRAALEEEGIL